MDGSSKDFLNLLKQNKIVDQSKKRKYLKILDNVELVEGKRKFQLSQTIHL